MIVPARPLDDDELLRFSADNPGWHIEREPDGSLSVSPTSYRNAIRAAEAVRQLFAWGGERGYAAASDGGVTLPDKSVRAPDASWISFERWHALTETQRYVEQGAVYGVLMDPEPHKVEEFGTRPDGLALDFDRIIDAG